jgi:hypothetical protein
VRSARVGGAALALALLLLVVAGGPARAQDGRVGFDVAVLAASPEPGGIDPAAQRFHALLGKRVRYESLRVLDTKRTRLAVGDIGRVRLPTGTDFRFRPLDVGEHGVLVAVDMGSTAQGDFRIRKGKPLILGGQPYRDGQLVVILEAKD